MNAPRNMQHEMGRAKRSSDVVSQVSGTRVEASRGVEHYTRLPQHTSLRLTTNKPNRLKPDMKQQHSPIEARPQAALAQPSEARA